MMTILSAQLLKRFCAKGENQCPAGRDGAQRLNTQSGLTVLPWMPRRLFQVITLAVWDYTNAFTSSEDGREQGTLRPKGASKTYVGIYPTNDFTDILDNMGNIYEAILAMEGGRYGPILILIFMSDLSFSLTSNHL